MTRNLFLFVLILILVSCNKNEAPICQIMSPAADALILKTDTITVNIEASDPDGTLTEIRLYLNDIGLASLKEWPYEYELYPDDFAFGDNVLKAVAYDDESAETVSEIHLQVGLIPMIVSNPVTDIGTTSASFSGTLNNEPAEIETGFYISTSASSQTTGSKIIVEHIDHQFGTNYTELLAGTEYYVRAYGSNTFGTTLGEELMFETLPQSVPVVVISEMTEITDSSAQANVTITFDGNEDITVRGVCWNTEGNPGIEDSKTEHGSGSENFVSELEDLSESTTYYIRAYATNEVGIGYSSEIAFTTGIPDPISITDLDGNIYHTLRLGTQLWTIENLATTKYNDNTDIPNLTDGNDWITTSSGAYCWWENSISYKDPYGALYNAAAVKAGKLCPSGWHVPSDEEWKILEVFLGMSVSESNTHSNAGRGSETGGKLKETGTEHWLDPNTGATNESGLTVLPAGIRNNDGEFINQTTHTWLWSSTAYTSSLTWYRLLAANRSALERSSTWNERGASVRCVMDE